MPAAGGPSGRPALGLARARPQPLARGRHGVHHAPPGLGGDALGDLERDGRLGAVVLERQRDPRAPLPAVPDGHRGVPAAAVAEPRDGLDGGGGREASDGREEAKLLRGDGDVDGGALARGEVPAGGGDAALVEEVRGALSPRLDDEERLWVVSQAVRQDRGVTVLLSARPHKASVLLDQAG